MAKSKDTTDTAPTESAGAETRAFDAEVGRLLDIVANALYSNSEVFLRELISNASDACDRLRYEAITQPDLLGEDSAFRIVLTVDKDAGILTVEDNGIGMDREDLVAHLGTIARSGTAAFAQQLEQAAKQAKGQDGGAALSTIGQFGVGFYSAFTVAEQVTVTTRKAGTEGAWHWTSDGKGAYTVGPAETSEAPARGTRIALSLKADATEYLEEARLRQVVKTYSDHIGIPIQLGAGEGAATLNRASALWTRSKSEISEDEYKEFYHHVGHAFDSPWETIHYKAEGVIEYTGLLFVPGMRPFDLFDPERRARLKLYVRRVFITDDCAELLPSWLRFLRGVVDSEDLPLNVSREMLQTNPMVRKIRQGLVKRVLDTIGKRAKSDADGYATFWESFGAVLKEGLYEDTEHREPLLGLIRFRGTGGEGWVSLADYVARMKPGQEAIYTIAADSEGAARRSPQIEGFVAKGVEVLFLTDPVDEFWIPAIGAFEDKPFRSVTRAGTDLGKIEGDTPQDETASEKPSPADDTALATLVARFKTALGDDVKDVRLSDRLTGSPVCLVADEGDPDINLERLMRQHRHTEAALPRILEVNGDHALIRRLSEVVGEAGDAVDDAAQLLLDQARIAEGEPVRDPSAFARRLSYFVEHGLA